MVFAALTRRFAASLIDGFALVAISQLASRAGSIAWTAAVVAALAMGCVVLPATRIQATPGQRLLAIKVTGMDGERIGLARSGLRFAFSILTLSTLGLGFIAAAWLPKRQALHDYGARTLVVNRSAKPAEVARAEAPPMGWLNGALGVLFLCAFLGALYAAFDARRTFESRERTHAAIDDAAAYRDEVGAAILAGAALPPPPANLDPFTRALYVQADGRVVIETSDALHPGGRIVLAPSRTPQGVAWRCSALHIEPRYLPSDCRS